MTAPSDNGRAEALAALLATRDTGMSVAPTPVKDTGDVVEAGGDVERRLVKPTHLGYRLPTGGFQLVDAKVGDVIRVTAAQAKRLDRLGATVDPADDLDDVADQLGTGVPTDAELGAMKAADLVAYVAQHPDERARVRLLEEARPQPRVTVLDATEPTEEADAEAQAQAQAAQQ